MLVRTSNPGAAELQDAGRAGRCTSGSPRSSTSWAATAAATAASRGVGAVVGATEPELLGRLRELMPRAIFLLPGVGAQGGRVEDLGAGVRPAPGRRPRHRLALDRERARERGGDPAAAAAAAAEELRAAAWEL